MFTRFIAAVLAVVSSQSLFADEPLNIGQPAPPIAVESIDKGTAFSEFVKGTTYAIVFTVRNRPNCEEVIPSLNEVQKKNPKVKVMSVYFDELEVLQTYVKQHKQVFKYAVYADSKRKSLLSWMGEARIDTFPTVFIVNGDKKIAWIGETSKMASPLEKIVAGKYDEQCMTFQKNLNQVMMQYDRAMIEEHSICNRICRNAEEMIRKEKKYKQAIELLEATMVKHPHFESMLNDVILLALACDPGEKDEHVQGFTLKLCGKVGTELRSEQNKPTYSAWDCSRFASTLLIAHTRNPKQWYLAAAEYFIEQGERRATEAMNDATHLRKQGFHELAEFKSMRVRMADGQDDWDTAIRLQKERIEMIKKDDYFRFVREMSEKHWELHQKEVTGREELYLDVLKKVRESRTKKAP